MAAQDKEMFGTNYTGEWKEKSGMGWHDQRRGLNLTWSTHQSENRIDENVLTYPITLFLKNTRCSSIVTAEPQRWWMGNKSGSQAWEAEKAVTWCNGQRHIHARFTSKVCMYCMKGAMLYIIQINCHTDRL